VADTPPIVRLETAETAVFPAIAIATMRFAFAVPMFWEVNVKDVPAVVLELSLM